MLSAVKLRRGLEMKQMLKCSVFSWPLGSERTSAPERMRLPGKLAASSLRPDLGFLCHPKAETLADPGREMGRSKRTRPEQTPSRMHEPGGAAAFARQVHT